mmetsp:Transcript_14346/g.28567  ORF Transcript_14346/g.28567 Transcript_14346/m.28567 type:complete len:199 (+) Transcript_14346:35-631(+)
MSTDEQVPDAAPVVDAEDSDDEMPALEEAEAVPAGGAGGEQAAGAGRQNRAEKKARKMLAKLNLRPVTDIMRVALKKSKTVLFIISQPDVFKAPNQDLYVVFGEASIEDLTQRAQADAANTFARQQQAAASNLSAGGDAAPAAAAAAADDDEDVDEEGVESKDVELIMQQASCSRGQAVRALKNNEGDLVNAIMELTM